MFITDGRKRPFLFLYWERVTVYAPSKQRQLLETEMALWEFMGVYKIMLHVA